MTGTVETIPIAFWLLPAEADSHWLATRIRVLAAQHGGQSFEPHVTLHVGRCPPDTDVEGLLAAVAHSEPTSGLAVQAGQTRTSAIFFKALFVDLQAPPGDGAGLPRMRRQLMAELLKTSSRLASTADAVATPAAISKALMSYEFLPHLSLLYGEFSQTLRLELAAANDIRGRAFQFDGVAAVMPKVGHTDLSRVECWNVFGHRRFDG